MRTAGIVSCQRECLQSLTANEAKGEMRTSPPNCKLHLAKREAK